MQTSPAASVPAPMPAHAPQPVGRSVAPAAVRMASVPSAAAVAVVCSEAGAMRKRTPGATCRPRITSAAIQVRKLGTGTGADIGLVDGNIRVLTDVGRVRRTARRRYLRLERAAVEVERLLILAAGIALPGRGVLDLDAALGEVVDGDPVRCDDRGF